MKIWGFGAEESAVEAAQANVDRARAKHDGLVAQLQDAERELASLKAAAIDSAMERGRLDDEGNDIAAASAGCETLRAAVARAQRELTDAQATLAHEQDQAERSKSVATVEQLQQDMREPFEQLISAIAKLLPLVQRAGMFSLDVQQVAGLLQQWELDASDALQITTTALKLHDRSSGAGTNISALHRPGFAT
jgi:chromosome segregation ATPase